MLYYNFLFANESIAQLSRAYIIVSITCQEYIVKIICVVEHIIF